MTINIRDMNMLKIFAASAFVFVFALCGCEKKTPGVLELSEVELSAPEILEKGISFKGKCKDPSVRVSQIDVRYEPKDANAWVRVRPVQPGFTDEHAKNGFGFTVLKAPSVKKIQFGESRREIWSAK